MAASPGPLLLALTLTKPYVETHRVGIVWIVVAIATAVIELSGAFRRRPGATRRDRGSQFVIRICVIPGAVLFALSPKIAPAAEMRPPFDWVVGGIVIFAAGEALRVWAKVALGKYFTYVVMTSSDQPVITNGPYRALRHPSYAGVLLMAIGCGAVYGNWLGLVGLALLITVALVYRISVEERALLQELGDRYRSYAEHHKRLIPFVW